MNHSPSLEIMMSLAAHEAQSGGFPEILPEHIFAAVLKMSEIEPDVMGKVLAAHHLLEEYRLEVNDLRVKLASVTPDTQGLRRHIRKRLGAGPGISPGAIMHRSNAAKDLFRKAEELIDAQGGEALTPGSILVIILMFPPTPLLLELVGMDKIPLKDLIGTGDDDDEIRPSLPSPTVLSPDPATLPQLTSLLRQMRSTLMESIFGQDQAIQAFVEGMFNAEVIAAADENRTRPKALFVFAGPPGVGKTFLAESGVAILGRPFKRFDMSGYADRMGVALLAGAQRSYQGAKSGLLTEFVNTAPDAVLLFDEIEKAGTEVIHLFLQLLDNGTLEDKFTEETTVFKDTVIIFTTNAGRLLYSDPNSSGAGAARGGFHRKTILNALATDKDPRTGRPFFPEAICSRLATGHPVMFNHLGVNELERIAAKELARVGRLIGTQYDLEVTVGPAVPLCLVMREGVQTDARTVRAQAETFLKSELFKFASLYQSDRLQTVIEGASRIRIDLEPEREPELDEDIRALMAQDTTPKVLLAATAEKAFQVAEAVPGLDMKVTLDIAGAKELLALDDFDFVLLDLWFDCPESAISGNIMQTVQFFDHVPVAARSIHNGQELLRHIHETLPELPVFLLSIPGPDGDGTVDQELLLACSHSGGARGIIEKCPTVSGAVDMARRIQEVALAMLRERQASQLGSQGKALSFDTAPVIDESTGDIHFRIRNLKAVRALSADDLDAVISDAERPTTLFEDVFGADRAKSELGFIVDWLKDPRRFGALDLKPPKGILMFGPPGTGKTMLARALAGESDVNFIAESATNFITKYVGSGPENIRNLFVRARRYAPSILFIDEIDAIGKKRSGGEFNRPQEETLNSLLTEMDGFTSSPTRPVIVVAATNLVESLDDALVRRFDREIEVDKPDRAAREAYLRKRLTGAQSKEVSEPVIERIAGQSAGMTIAQLERVVRLAGRTAATEGVPVTDEILEEAFETMRMGDASGPATNQETLLRVARHEAGHCLVGWLHGEKPVQITIVARGKAGGFVEREADEGKMLYTKGELEAMICRTMAGRAAEMLYYGPDAGLSSGVQSDLETATHWAGLMVRRFGMSPEMGQVAMDGKRITDGLLAEKVTAAVENIVSNQLKSGLVMLQENQATMDVLVDTLMEKNRLTREELEEFMPSPK